MTAFEPRLAVTVPARPENVAAIREATGRLAARLGMDEVLIGDLKTVLTEACMNVVLHAYEGEEPGPLRVEAMRDRDGFVVAVRDFGGGIRPSLDHRESLGIGLALIASLSSSYQIRGGREFGTEVRMHLPIGSTAPAESGCEGQPSAF